MEDLELINANPDKPVYSGNAPATDPIAQKLHGLR